MGVARKVLEWAMRKKGKPEVLVRSVMRLFEGAETGVFSEMSEEFEGAETGVYSEMSEEFEVKVGMHQGSVLSSFPFILVADVVGKQSEF